MVCPVDMIPKWSARENEKVANCSSGGRKEGRKEGSEERKEEREGKERKEMKIKKNRKKEKNTEKKKEKKGQEKKKRQTKKREKKRTSKKQKEERKKEKEGRKQAEREFEAQPVKSTHGLIQVGFFWTVCSYSLRCQRFCSSLAVQKLFFFKTCLPDKNDPVDPFSCASLKLTWQWKNTVVIGRLVSFSKRTSSGDTLASGSVSLPSIGAFLETFQGPPIVFCFDRVTATLVVQVLARCCSSRRPGAIETIPCISCTPHGP